MYSNTAIKIRLRSAHLDRNAKTLEHLARSRADDVQSNDLLILPRTHELVRARNRIVSAFEDRVIQTAELCRVDLDVGVTIALPCRWLCQPDAAYLGM